VDSPSVYLNLKFICKNNRSTIYRVTTNTTRQPGAEFWSSTAHGTPFSRLPVALPCLGDWRLETRGGPTPAASPTVAEAAMFTARERRMGTGARAAPVRPPGTGWPNQSGCVFHGRRTEAPRPAWLFLGSPTGRGRVFQSIPRTNRARALLLACCPARRGQGRSNKSTAPRLPSFTHRVLHPRFYWCSPAPMPK
jgi:hypothetical protein